MILESVLYGILRLSSRIRPNWLKKKILLYLLDGVQIGVRLKQLFSQSRLPVCLISGVEKNSGSTITVLFLGETRFPVYLKDIIFSDIKEVQHLAKSSISKINDVVDRLDLDVDMVLVSCDQFFQRFLFKQDFFVLPHIVDMVLDTSDSVNEIVHDFSHSAKEDIRKVRKKDFSFDVTTDIDQLNMFYNDMFLPMLSERIGETDMYTPDFTYLQVLRKIGHELMIILLNKREVSGVTFIQRNKEITLKYAGVLDGDIDLIKEGAFSAYYYFFIMLAKDRGVKKIDWGGTRPFFCDGLFKYKVKWTTHIEPYSSIREVFGLKVINDKSEAVKQFLVNNPFISKDKHNEFVGCVFLDNLEKKDQMRKKFEKKYSLTGLNEIRFYEVYDS